jgi:hypothetical protein
MLLSFRAAAPAIGRELAGFGIKKHGHPFQDGRAFWVDLEEIKL